MNLRPELIPPRISPERLAEISTEITRIEKLIHTGSQAAVDEAIAAFNEDADGDYEPGSFTDYAEARSLEAFALEAARPSWPRVPGITRAELAEIVRLIQAADPDTDYYLLILDANTPHPHVHSLIFNPRRELENATAEEIVAAAFAYATIAL